MSRGPCARPLNHGPPHAFPPPHPTCPLGPSHAPSLRAKASPHYCRPLPFCILPYSFARPSFLRLRRNSPSDVPKTFFRFLRAPPLLMAAPRPASQRPCPSSTPASLSQNTPLGHTRQLPTSSDAPAPPQHSLGPLLVPPLLPPAPSVSPLPSFAPHPPPAPLLPSPSPPRPPQPTPRLRHLQPSTV